MWLDQNFEKEIEMQKEEFKEVFEKEINEKTEEIIEKTEVEENTEEKTEENVEAEEKTNENTEPTIESDEFDDLGDIGDPEEIPENGFIEIEEDEEKKKKCHCECDWGVAAHCAITAAICFIIFSIILICSKKKQEIHLIIDDYAVSSASIPSATVGTYYITEGENRSNEAAKYEIDMAKQFHLNNEAEESQAKIGIDCVTVDKDSIAQGLPKGVYVITVPEGSSAHISGILAGDIITEIDGQAIESTEDLMNLLKTYEPGDRVRISVVRYADGIVNKDISLILSK